MKVVFLAAAALLLGPISINARQNSTTEVGKAGKSKAGAVTAAAANATTHLDPTETRSLTGVYTGIDTKDASTQRVVLFCDVDEEKDKGVCDITLADNRFSTCDLINPGTNDGIGIANSIPIDSIGDFSIDLYCLEPGETEIDFSKKPSTTLRGDMEILADGGIRRKGAGFFYPQVSIPEITDMTREVVNINDKSVNINGRYRGMDLIGGGATQVSNCGRIIILASFVNN